MKNEKQIKFRLVHFSIFIFSGKMKNELRFCLIFIFCEKNWKMKNRQKFIFLKNKVSLYTCFQNQVIHAFRGHFFAKLKSEMAELSSGLGNSDEFIALSRGHGDARVNRKLKKT